MGIINNPEPLNDSTRKTLRGIVDRLRLCRAEIERNPPSKLKYMVNDEGEYYSVDVGTGPDLDTRIKTAVPEMIVNYIPFHGRKPRITGYIKITPAREGELAAFFITLELMRIYGDTPGAFEVFIRDAEYKK